MNQRPRPFAHTHKPSRAERRAAEARAQTMAAARAHGGAHPGLFGEPAPDAPEQSSSPMSDFTAAASEEVQRSRRPLPGFVHLIGGSILALFGLCTAIVVGAPVLEHRTRLVWLAGGACVAGVGGLWAHHGFGSTGRPVRYATFGLCAVILASMAWGVHTSVVVGGHVYLDSSPAARNYKMTSSLDADLATISSLDPMLSAGADWQGAHYQSFVEAQSTLSAISIRWLDASHNGLPSTVLTQPVEAIANAAYYESQAFKYAAQNIDEPDAKVAAQSRANRSNYVSAAAYARARISGVVARFGFPSSLDPTRSEPTLGGGR